MRLRGIVELFNDELPLARGRFPMDLAQVVAGDIKTSAAHLVAVPDIACGIRAMGRATGYCCHATVMQRDHCGANNEFIIGEVV